jgi:ribonuclease HIII
MHGGEQDIAVAAASIVARKEFLNRLSQLSKSIGMELPRGAGSDVKQVAQTLVKLQGLDGLSKVAKLHFKTTQQVVVEEVRE